MEEKSLPNTTPQASFIYETFEKYHGEIQYKVVNPVTTTLWVLPSSLVSLKNRLGLSSRTTLYFYMASSSYTATQVLSVS